MLLRIKYNFYTFIKLLYYNILHKIIHMPSLMYFKNTDILCIVPYMIWYANGFLKRSAHFLTFR